MFYKINCFADEIKVRNRCSIQQQKGDLMTINGSCLLTLDTKRTQNNDHLCLEKIVARMKI